MSKFTNRKGKIRIYDGTATPFYLELDFDHGDISFPLGQPQTEELLILMRGTMDANAHYIEGPDDPMMGPLDLSFSAMLEDSAQTKWLLGLLLGDASVNSHTIVTTKGTTKRDGSNFNPAFSAATGSKKCLNVEYLLDGATNDIHLMFTEVNFPPAEQTIAESADGVNISIKGKIYGTITYNTSGFTSGTTIE
jgi:hypothetical protein